MNQTEIIQAIEGYMSASLSCNAEAETKARQAVEVLKKMDFPTEMSGRSDKE